MLHYLLYIVIQRGIPAMSCLDAVLTMMGGWNWSLRMEDGVWFWERLHGALL